MTETIYPGTTPTLTFTFPEDIDPSTCQRILLLLTQGDNTIVKREVIPVYTGGGEWVNPEIGGNGDGEEFDFDDEGGGSGGGDIGEGINPYPADPYKNMGYKGQDVIVSLSKEETMRFCPFPTIGLELWVKTGSGNIPDPWMTSIPIGRVRNKEVL